MKCCFNDLFSSERPRENPADSAEISLEEPRPVRPEATTERPATLGDTGSPLLTSLTPSTSSTSSSTSTSTRTPSTAAPERAPAYQVPGDSSSQILLVSMSAFSVAVFAVITAGCSLGLYRKYKYPDLGSGSRPTSRTGTIDSRRSSGSRRSVESSESRRSQRSQRSQRRRQREREKEREDDNICSELRVKSRPDSLVSNLSNFEDDLRAGQNSTICDKDHEVNLTHPPPLLHGVHINIVPRVDQPFHPQHPRHPLYQPNICTPTQLRQQVSLNSFKGGGGGGGGYRSLERTKAKPRVSLASTESLTLSNLSNGGLEDSLRQHGRKIRFNPYDEFSD